MNKPMKVKLHILSPTHIGCGEDYEPTSFVIDETRKKLIAFDLMEFVKSLKPNEITEFNRVASGDNLLAIFKAIKCYYKPSIEGREVEITNFLVDHYKKILRMDSFEKRAVINQFTINRTAYNSHSNLPYIPASSLKGSLRTAHLSSLAQSRSITEYWKNCGLLSRDDLRNPNFTYRKIGEKYVAKHLEKTLLGGDFETDPFRLLKISDLLPTDGVKTKIVYAVNKNKKKSVRDTNAGMSGVYQIFETIQPGTVFEGAINLDLPPKGLIITHPFKDLKSLLMASHNFYVGVLDNEVDVFQNALDIKHKAGIDANLKFKEKIKKTSFLIRLGRHSGAEAVTIEGNRNIKIMQGRNRTPKYFEHSTTIWLASDEPRPATTNNLFPFGWAILEVVEN
jgi:CRISPR-associated protein Csm5